MLSRPVIPEGDLYRYQHSATNLEVLNVSEIYLKAVNTLIKTHSDNSTLCFLYLPAPPSNIQQAEKQSSNDTNKVNNKKYISVLETLSDSLPPCVFVNGVNVVTSTTL